MSTIVIIDYGAGNLRSVEKALARVGYRSLITSRPDEILAAGAAILPGVGAFAACMAGLEKHGLVPVISEVIRLGKPFLGICVGLQLLFTESEEDGRLLVEAGENPGNRVDAWQGLEWQGLEWRRLEWRRPEGRGPGEGFPRGLDILPGRVVRFPAGRKIPQIGWNQVSLRRPDPLFEGIPDQTFFYFVHSYYAVPEDPEIVAGTSTYGVEFAAAIHRDNLFAVQFHPEKSGKSGLRLLQNFARLAEIGNARLGEAGSALRTEADKTRLAEAGGR